MSYIKLSENQLKEAVRIIADAGVDFYIINPIEGGLFDLRSNQIVDFIKNSDRYFANEYGVSIETVRDYKAYIREFPRCSATTKKNRQCKNLLSRHKKIKEFEKDRLDFCRLHSKSNL